ncbi:ABC transporter [Anopheles sinensis]|uniref:ABC transporter n=1 Tax=Anopheles sinensis TaxID=74873 RepID=A0A084VMV1_ANOSI|nr:ABC transporter [Anopheles sinensis]
MLWLTLAAGNPPVPEGHIPAEPTPRTPRWPTQDIPKGDRPSEVRRRISVRARFDTCPVVTKQAYICDRKLSKMDYFEFRTSERPTVLGPSGSAWPECLNYSINMTADRPQGSSLVPAAGRASH